MRGRERLWALCFVFGATFVSPILYASANASEPRCALTEPGTIGAEAVAELKGAILQKVEEERKEIERHIDIAELAIMGFGSVLAFMWHMFGAKAKG